MIKEVCDYGGKHFHKQAIDHKRRYLEWKSFLS